MKNNTSLRQFIRSVLREDYRVTISGIPIDTGEKRKRGVKPPESIVTNIVLDKNDLEDLIQLSNDKDLLKPSVAAAGASIEQNEVQEEIDRRIQLIEARVDGGCAKLAKMLIKMTDPDKLGEILFNMPDESGAVNIEHPQDRVYDIPALFNQLADYSKPGARGKSIGKGEALAILMFGRDNADEPEPDLIVGGTGYDVKYFENASSTVETGASLENSEDINELIELTARFWNSADELGVVPKTGRLVSRKRISEILKALKSVYQEKDDANKQLDDIARCGHLWDTVTLSAYKTLCLVGGSKKSFYSVAPENMITGAIDFSKSMPIIKIASPISAANLVSTS